MSEAVPTLDPGSGLTAATLHLTDGRSLRYVHAGEGGPVVVFEAGMGCGAGEWVTVQRLVSATASTVSYDRAGHGASTEDPHDRTLARIGEDLHALLEEVAPGQPVILVAHSWGGPIVRSFAEQHPDRVAGVVMVDTTLASLMSERMAKSIPFSASISRRLHPLLKPLTRRVLFKHVPADLSAQDRAVLEREFSSPRSLKTAVREGKQIAPSLASMARWEQDGLPNVPVISVMGGGTGRVTKARQRFIGAAEAEMARHPHGECRVLTGTAHLVPQDKPIETAQAILDVVAKARQLAAGAR